MHFQAYQTKLHFLKLKQFVLLLKCTARTTTPTCLLRSDAASYSIHIRTCAGSRVPWSLVVYVFHAAAGDNSGSAPNPASFSFDPTNMQQCAHISIIINIGLE